MASCGLILDDIIVSSIASAATYGRSAARSWNGRKEPREREVEQQLLLDDVHDVIVVEQLLRVQSFASEASVQNLSGRYSSSKKCNSLGGAVMRCFITFQGDVTSCAQLM